MEIIQLLLPVALLLAGSAVAGFIWAARKGQFDDLETPAIRMLFDDEILPNPDDKTHPNTDDPDQTTDSEADSGPKT